MYVIQIYCYSFAASYKLKLKICYITNKFITLFKLRKKPILYNDLGM